MVQDPAADEELAYNNESRQVIIYQPRAMEPLDDIGQQFDNNNAGNSSSVVSLVLNFFLLDIPSIEMEYPKKTNAIDRS